jgi:hypothetical protein
MAITDTLTTREALRRAVLEDVVSRCDIVAQTIGMTDLEGIEGVKFVSMGVLRDAVSAHLMVELPDPSEHHAEVSTPATIVTSAVCPECDLPVEITVKLTPQLAVDNDGAELKVKAKSKGRPHLHGQLSLPTEPDGQVSMDDVVIDDLRLRILRAVVKDVDPEIDVELIVWPSLDEIAITLELASESDRGDLEESLYAYSQLEAPLVEILSVKGEPVRYALTPAGFELVAAATDAPEDDEDDADADPDVEA